MGASRPLLTEEALPLAAGDADGRAPPGPKGAALFKLIDGIRHDRIAVVSLLRADHGPVAQIVLGPVRLVLVSEAKAAREVLRDTATFAAKGLGLHEARYFLGDGLLTASAGPSWGEARTALAGCFRRQRVDGFLGTTATAVDSAIAAMRERGASGQPIDVQPFVARISFATVEQAVFGAHSDARADAVIDDCETLSRWVEARFLLPLDALTRLSWLMSPRVRRAARRFRCQCALETHATAPVPEALRQRGLTRDDQLRDQMRTLLLAGFETTAAAICWTLDLLSRHPAWAARVAAEARAHIGVAGQTDVAPLGVTRAAVKEALRLYPPVWALPRRAATATRLGPYGIAAGSHVLINMHGVHRDAETWTLPDAFDPGRFLGTEPDPLSYMPFGIGARQCIGLHLALAEATYVVARILATLRLIPARATTPALAGLTLRPRDGLWLNVIPE